MVGDESQSIPTLLPQSLDSFKVLSDCPIIIALLFQLHKKFVPMNVPAMVPLIINVIQLQPAQQKAAHARAAAEGKLFTGMSPDILNKKAYSELISLQVKVKASFLTTSENNLLSNRLFLLLLIFYEVLCKT
jgi:transformation/transcription domain-associated protein